MSEPVFNDRDLMTPELRELDAELSRLRIRERASFGPELGAELSREWSEMEVASSSGRLGRLVAAGGGALVLVALVFTPARASLTRFIHALLPTSTPALVQEGPPTGPGAFGSSASTGESHVGDVRGSAPIVLARARPGAKVDASELTVFEPVEFTLPSVMDPNSFQALLEQHYPRYLQEARIGGKVRVRLWVDPNGSPSYVQVRASSGVPDLDQAAREAATHMVFEPARWLGNPIGTWVEFDVGFDPANVNA